MTKRLDEISKPTLARYVGKAADSLVDQGAELSRQRAASDEIYRFTNRNDMGRDRETLRDTLHKTMGADHKAQTKTYGKIYKRREGISRAVKRLQRIGEAHETEYFKDANHGLGHGADELRKTHRYLRDSGWDYNGYHNHHGGSQHYYMKTVEGRQHWVITSTNKKDFQWSHESQMGGTGTGKKKHADGWYQEQLHNHLDKLGLHSAIAEDVELDEARVVHRKRKGGGRTMETFAIGGVGSKTFAGHNRRGGKVMNASGLYRRDLKAKLRGKGVTPGQILDPAGGRRKMTRKGLRTEETLEETVRTLGTHITAKLSHEEHQAIFDHIKNGNHLDDVPREGFSDFNRKNPLHSAAEKAINATADYHADKYHPKHDHEDIVDDAHNALEKHFGTNEEVEQLDELSPQTLSSYVKKAATDARSKGLAAGVQHTMAAAAETDTKYPSDLRARTAKGIRAHADANSEKSHKRLRGINKAVDKLAYDSHTTHMKESAEDRLLGHLLKGTGEAGKLRLVKHYKNDTNHEAKLYKDSEWDEYRLKHFVDGKHQKDADYHTDDKQDAHDTALVHLSKGKPLSEAREIPAAAPAERKKQKKMARPKPEGGENLNDPALRPGATVQMGESYDVAEQILTQLEEDTVEIMLNDGSLLNISNEDATRLMEYYYESSDLDALDSVLSESYEGFSEVLENI